MTVVTAGGRRYGAEMAAPITITPVEGLPEIHPGDDLAAMIAASAEVGDGDVVLVTSKIVSKAEGCGIDLATVVPSAFATRWAQRWDKDARVIEVVLQQSARIVRQVGPILITETHHGFVCANAGVDQSSSGAHDRVLTLPVDVDASARELRAGFRAQGVDVAVIITDTFGRPWRTGQTDIAIGIAGMNPITSYVGDVDPHGHEFRVQELCVADELAAAGELVKGNTSRVPAAIVSGYVWQPDEQATLTTVLRDSSADLFR